MFKKKQGLKPVDHPDYRYWQALYLAFYSKRLFIDVVKRWRGFAIGYFLLLIGVISIPWTIHYTAQFKQYFSDELVYALQHMPLLTIQNGEVSIDKPTPYFVTGKSGEKLIEINPDPKMDKFSEEYPTVFVLITKDKIYYRSPKIQLLSKVALPAGEEKVSSHAFDKNDNEIFSGREWVKRSKVSLLEAYASFFIYPIVFGAFFGLYSAFNLVMSSIGRLISSVILKYKITFNQSFRLAWVASTAPLIFLTILQCLGVETNGSGAYYTAIVACYFAYAIIAVKRESNTMVRW